MKPSQNVEKMVRRLHFTAGAEMDGRIWSHVLKAQEELKKNKTAKLQPPVWRIIMKRKITKLAAAAVIVIAVLAGLPFFSGNGSGVVLADVLEKVEQAHVFIYRMKMTMTGAMMSDKPAGKKEIESTVTVSNQYGMKAEMTMTDADTGQEEMTQQCYILPDQKLIIIVTPEQKKYTRMEFDDDLLARMKKQNNDPREMIKQIMSCEYTELGRSVIDGIKVEGFQTTDPSWAGGAGVMESVKVSLWVDVESWLPVHAEMDFKMNEQMQMSGVIYDYQWDVQADATDFEPVIPEDFTAFPKDGVKVPSITEEAAIEGLALFAEFAGKYPQSLNLITLVQDICKLRDGQSPAAEQFRQKLEQAESEEQRTAERREMMQPIQSLGMFYMMLVQDEKEPSYYGESVGPDNANAVLLRWKVSDDQYRVVYGDLTTENVSAERLAELENPSSQ
jgi:outer membrane lipoprotein-sorting protein